MLSAGTLLLVPPCCSCRLVKGQDAAVRTLAFSRSLVDPLTLEPSVNLMVGTMSASEPQASHLSPTELEQADFLFSSLAKEAQQKGTGYQSMVRLKLMEVLLLLSRGRCGGEGADSCAPFRFHPEEAMQHISDRCADPLTLSEIASRYGLNPSYFSRLFRRHAGMPLVEFINRARIQKSCQLLKRSRSDPPPGRRRGPAADCRCHSQDGPGGGNHRCASWGDDRLTTRSILLASLRISSYDEFPAGEIPTPPTYPAHFRGRGTEGASPG